MSAFPLEVQTFFYIHHFSLYLLIRLFSGIGYFVGISDDNASWYTSDGVLQPYLSYKSIMTLKYSFFFFPLAVSKPQFYYSEKEFLFPPHRHRLFLNHVSNT